MIDKYCTNDIDLLSNDNLKKLHEHHHRKRTCEIQFRGKKLCRFKKKSN